MAVATVSDTCAYTFFGRKNICTTPFQFASLVVGMRVRLTQTVEKGSITVDQTGTQATERLDAPVVPLRYFPCCVHVKLDRFDSDTECLRFLDDEPCARHGTDGIPDSCNEGRNFASRVAIEPFTNRCPWSIEIKVLDVSVKVQRVQLPFVCASASTLHFFKELRVFRA